MPEEPISAPMVRITASRGRRHLLFALGWACVALGALGAFLPVLPTTPFLLVALWAFSQSSHRFHDWLYSHKLFGPPLQRWHQHGIIPLSAKAIALVTMAASLTYLTFFTETPLYLMIIAGAVMAFGAAFILSRPSRPKPDQPR